jgi:hypothetical protein
MLNAIHQETYPAHSPIPDLPLELQEMILDYACPPETHHLFDRAIFAAKLGIGVPFSFQSQTFSVRLRMLHKEGEIDPTEPEYHVLFWAEYVGMTYQVDKGEYVGMTFQVDKGGTIKPPWSKATNRERLNARRDFNELQ